MRTAALALACLGALLAGPAEARAGDRAEAERYFRKGNELFAEAKYEEAAKAFGVCVALAPELPGPYRRLGQAYKALGRCAEAVDQFLKYLELKRDGAYADDIRKEMGDCARQARLAPPDPGGPRTGQVEVSVDQPGAEVRFDGQTVGTTPVGPLALKPGRYEVTVLKEGYAPWEGEIEIAAGATVAQEVRLLEARPSKAPATPSGGGSAATARRAGWALGAVSLVAAVTGVVMGVMALQKSRTYADAGEKTDRRGVKEDGESLALAADVALASAALLGAGGVLLVVGGVAASDAPASGPALDDALEGDVPPPAGPPAASVSLVLPF